MLLCWVKSQNKLLCLKVKIRPGCRPRINCCVKRLSLDYDTLLGVELEQFTVFTGKFALVSCLVLKSNCVQSKVKDKFTLYTDVLGVKLEEITVIK